jgi:DNA repair exonuclease SbcCD ATPase subunit
MTRDQINRLEMSQATLNHMDMYAGVWNAVPVIGRYKNQLQQIIREIKEKADDQESAKLFIAKSVRELKKEVALKMDVQDDILEAYAADTDNAELLAKVTNSYSDYFTLSNENFEIKVKNVIRLLENYVEKAADYGSSVEQIEDIKTSFNDWLEHRGKTREYQIASGTATQSLDQLFKEMTPVLKNLDNVTKRFRRSNPTFFIGYISARQVVDN